ncbi:MAG: hypothetical protein AAFO04_19280 [Cyanobacteria bacterium J06592_8]
MQLSPTYRALLRVIPDLSWIYNFKKALGRGKCPWVHGMTKAGAKVSRFLKKGLIKAHTWLNDSEVVSTSRDRVYTVSQSECSCPEWKHRISKDKGYRHIPELFKGYVDCCKHQVQHWLRSHDVSHFSEFINIEDNSKHSIESLLNSPVPEGISLSKSIDSEGYFWGLSVRFNYWNPPKTEYGEYKKEQRTLGLIKICKSAHAHAQIGDIEVFISRRNLLGKGFNNLDDAIDYLLRYHRLNREMAFEPDEIKAINDLFGEPPEYPMQEYFEEERIEESKPTKKWFSLSNLQNQEMPF